MNCTSTCMTKILVQMCCTNNKTFEFQISGSTIMQHDYYGLLGNNDSAFNNDIALLKLKDPISIDGLRRPICLPEKDESFLDVDCFITG